MFIKKNLQYLKYVLIHKWFVLVAGYDIGASLWRLLIHDLSKFRPNEWKAYTEYFYGGPHYPWSGVSMDVKTKFGLLTWHTSKEQVECRFDEAWLMHIHRNPHHWQFWLLKEDSGSLKEIEMPRSYMLEMVADWMGAGRAITGTWETREWYNNNKENILLHPETRLQVEEILNKI